MLACIAQGAAYYYETENRTTSYEQTMIDAKAWMQANRVPTVGYQFDSESTVACLYREPDRAASTTSLSLGLTTKCCDQVGGTRRTASVPAALSSPGSPSVAPAPTSE